MQLTLGSGDVSFPMQVKDISEVNIDVLLNETFTATTIMTDKKNQDNQQMTVRVTYLEIVAVGLNTLKC